MNNYNVIYNNFCFQFITQYNFIDTTCEYYAEPIHQVIMLALNAAVLAAYFPAELSCCIRSEYHLLFSSSEKI